MEPGRVASPFSHEEHGGAPPSIEHVHHAKFRTVHTPPATVKSQTLAFDKGWCSQALAHRSPATCRPEAPALQPAAISAAKILPGFIAAPGHQYAVPPEVVHRCINGQTEGQLQWQCGKVACLSPTYTTYWAHDPPQRLNVMDLRLQPSQRSTSCYSPEYLTEHAAWAVDPRPDSADSIRSAPVTSSRPPSRIRDNPFISSHLELSPPGPHRVNGYKEPVFHRLNGSSRPASPATPTAPPRPHTSQGFVQSKASASMKPAGEQGRWGSKSMGAVCALQRSKAKEKVQHSRTGMAAPCVNGYMQKSLPPSPLTDIVRSRALSSFATQDKQQRTLLTRAASACSLSRSRSLASREGQAVAVGTCPQRDTHYPAPTEAQLRVGRIHTYDKRKDVL